jgi:hypothetical protein
MILYKIYSWKKMILGKNVNNKKAESKLSFLTQTIEPPIKQYPLGRSEDLSLVTDASFEVQ